MNTSKLVYGLSITVLFLYQPYESVAQPSTSAEQDNREELVSCSQADLYSHTRSVAHKVFDAWISPGRFTKNPDMAQLPSGRLMLVYSDNDAHWSVENQVLTILASDDQGKNWYLLSKVDSADMRQGEERLVTPRLSYLSDGRLVVLCDHDDFSYFHYDQGSGIDAWWSEDGGKTWSEPQRTGILGFEPDRMIELPGGKLAVGSHIMNPESQEYEEIISVSEDGGKTWNKRATIAHDGYHFFCEGALVLLNGGKELACIMRENHSAGIPSFVAFSQDNGKTWSEPQPCPFALHRPYAKQLADGRVLVTGRNMNGGLGTYAWVGDIKKEAGKIVPGGPRIQHEVKLSDEAMVISNGPALECRYTLLPPESSKSEILFEAEMKVEGEPDSVIAFMSVSKLRGPRPLVLYIYPDRIALGSQQVDFARKIDMTDYRKVTLTHKQGLCRVLIDGKVMINVPISREENRIGEFNNTGDVSRRTQFGQFGDRGKSYWKNVNYTVNNISQPEYSWQWNAESNEYPNHYERERLIQVHANHPNQQPRPDHGYSSWIQQEDGTVFLVDYTNCGDVPEKSHIVGVYIAPEDLN